MTKLTADDWRGLAHDLTGDVTTPDDDTYESLRRPALERFHDVRPQAVVRCRTADDVGAAVLFAHRHRLAVAIRSGGHDFAGHSSTTGLVLDVSLMNDVSLSGDIVTVGAGTLLGDLYPALTRAGRAIPGGSCPTVGVSGLTLGGGLGWLGRSYGLTCDSLVHAQIVLSDGRIVDCDDAHEPDLFWALRGAGAGRFGVVTSMRFVTVPAPGWTVFEGTFDHGHAAAVVDAWQSWSPGAPDTVAASLLLTAPADMRRPPDVRIWGAATGHSPEETDGFFDALVERAGVQPRTWRRQELSWPDDRLETAGGESDSAVRHMFVKSEYFRRPLPTSAIDELVGLLVADRRDGEERELDLSPWGGAYVRRPVDATAFPHRDALYLVKHSALVDAGSPGSAASGPSAWLQRSWQAVRPWGTGGVFPNFPDDGLDDPPRAYFGANLDRIRRIQATYDPLRLLAS